jgi:hypothetical protein
MIIETLVTTLDGSGGLNCAPMGVEWGDETIVIKPFADTTTCRNLEATGTAVINLTDDALLFAKAVTGHPDAGNPPTVPAARVTGRVLATACSWREVEVAEVDPARPRSRFTTRVVHRGSQREFLGFNRARHAVLEAAILATRTHLIPRGEIRAEFERLRVIVEKTAGPDEHAAMRLLEEFVASKPDGTPAR